MKSRYSRLLKVQLESKGDTIVEVLLSMTVLAIVLATAFISSSHSLQNGVDAGNRNKALAYAQEQIEFIKNAALQNPPSAAKYQIAAPFCIDPSNGSPVLLGSATNPCNNYFNNPNSQYAVSIDYDGVSSSPTFDVFTITTNWQGVSGVGTNQVRLYYRMPK